MIAPLASSDAQATEAGRHLRPVRRLIASMFLKPEPGPAGSLPPARAWRAWLFAAWVVSVTGFYFATMLGLL